jgi:hypothetical protein
MDRNEIPRKMWFAKKGICPPPEKLSALMEDFLSKAGYKTVQCPRPYVPAVPIKICCWCSWLAGLKEPQKEDNQVLLCSFNFKIQEVELIK